MALSAEPGQPNGRCQPEQIFKLLSFFNLTELHRHSSTAEKTRAVKQSTAQGKSGTFPSAEKFQLSEAITKVLQVREVIKCSAVSEPQTLPLHDKKEIHLSKLEPTFFHRTCDILDTDSEKIWQL